MIPVVVLCIVVSSLTVSLAEKGVLITHETNTVVRRGEQWSEQIHMDLTRDGGACTVC